MVRSIFLTYANEKFLSTAEKYVGTAQAVGFEKTRIFTRSELEQTEFYAKNRDIFDVPRGNGYWLWKPYAIWDTLRNLDEDEVLIYNDAGRGRSFRLWDRYPTLMTQIAREFPQGMIAGYATHIWGQSRMTKRDTFVIMGAENDEMYHAPQITASWSVWRRTPEAMSFLESWLDYGTRPGCITDDPSVLVDEEFPDFQDHRHDQAIFSILVHQRRVRHINYVDKTIRQALSAESRASSERSQFPKRVASAEDALARVLRERGHDPEKPPKNVSEILADCFQYYSPDDKITKLVRLDRPHRPTIIKHAKEFARSDPNKLTWRHANARLKPDERALLKSIVRGKRPEFIEYLKEQAVIFLREGCPENDGRLNFNVFWKDHFNFEQYDGDPDDIVLPPKAVLRMEKFNKTVRENPDAVDWKTVWSVMDAGRRKLWKKAIAGLKIEEIEMERQRLIKRLTGGEDLDDILQSLPPRG